MIQSYIEGEVDFLTEEDAVGLTGDEYSPGPSPLTPPEVVPTEAIDWAEALFERSDVVEFRGIPPKQLAAEMDSHAFAWRWTRRRHLFYPWVHAGAIRLLLGDLAAMNAAEGILTGWRHRSREGWQRTFEVIPSVPLNIYGSANPRSRPGGSSRQDVRLARSLFADLDKTNVGAAEQAREAAGLPRPTMIVDSGHGVHLYWRLWEPISDMGRWTSIQKSLIAALGSDPAVHDPARVMRVPGYVNVNGDPVPATIVEVDPARRHELGELLASLPVVEPPPGHTDRILSAAPAVATIPSPSEDRPHDSLARMLAYLRQIEPPVEGERNARLFTQAARLLEKFDPGEDDLLAAISSYNARCVEPLDDGEVVRVVGNACRHVHAKGAQRGTLLNVVHESHREADGEIIPLDQLRGTLAEARLHSLGKPGAVCFDGSMTGVGKSTADRAAMLKAGKSLTILPTHDACDELAQTLVEAGLSAAAYPPIDASTCQKFGTDRAHGEARMALEAGLNVGEAVCPDCPFHRSCEYQRRRELARNANHAVATHARASSSRFAVAEGRPVVFIHEDPLALLRPMVKVAAKPVGPQAPHVGHLREVVRLAKAAEEVAERIGDEEKLEFARHLARSTQGLVLELEDDSLVEDIRAAEREGRRAVPPRAIALPKKEPTRRPDRCDYLLYRAMRHSGIDPDRDALRLALAHACGELEHLCVVVEDTYTRAKGGQAGGEREYHKALVGVWRVDPPEEAVVWFEDATGDRALLEELLGRSVHDRTPVGRPRFQVPPVQYTSMDVTQRTEDNVVRGLVRGLLAGRSDAVRVGVITQREHMASLEGLEPLWSSRIVRKEYFRSGKDRASNSWLDLDLILVLGTPRVPPSAVRDWLVRTGRIDAAGRDGGWGRRSWEGRTAEGPLIRVEGHGYAEPSWRAMNHLLVRATLLQSIGRGRGVTEKGIPVLVVSNENLGIPLSATPTPSIKDPEARTFVAFLELTAKNPKYDIVGQIAVNASQLAHHLSDVQERQLRNHLTHLTDLGLLAKKGGRGGWTLAR